MTSSERPRASWFPDSTPAAPRTLDEAMGQRPAATLAVIGAPRAIAPVEVRRALEHGLDVLVVGEGLAPDDAAAEAAFAGERGLLLLVDDAVIDGTPIGGALAAVRTGGLAVVATDVAGAVEATCAAERAGYGAGQVLVVGDPDREEVVGGAATLAAVARLGADPGTTAITVIGPGDARVLRAIRHACVATGKPAVLCDPCGEPRRGIGWESVGSIAELPRALVRLGVDPGPPPPPRSAPARGEIVLGLLRARSTAHEVLGVLLPAGIDVASNVARAGVLPDDVGGHTVLALPSVAERIAWLERVSRTERVGAIVVDLPATPAADAEAPGLLAALGEVAGEAHAAGRELRVIAARSRPASRAPTAVDDALAQLGALVVEGAGAAATAALGTPDRGPVSAPPLGGRALSVITLAADDVAASLAARSVPVLPIAWSAPAGGDARLARLVGLLR